MNQVQVFLGRRWGGRRVGGSRQAGSVLAAKAGRIRQERKRVPRSRTAQVKQGPGVLEQETCRLRLGAEPLLSGPQCLEHTQVHALEHVLSFPPPRPFHGVFLSGSYIVQKPLTPAQSGIPL